MAAPTNVVVSGTTVTLTLAASVHYGDTVTVAYAQPGTGRIKDIAGNDAATFGAQAVTNATPSLPPDVPALVSPADGSTVATLTPTLSATFSDVDTNNTGQLTFRLCTTSNCSSPIGGTFSSSAGIANGADGSAVVPGGRITSDGTYYWQAKATDNTSAVSAFSTSHSFTVDTTAPLLQTAAVNGTSLTLTYDEALDTGSVPAALAYGLHANGGSSVAPTNVGVAGSVVTLTFAVGTVHNGDSVTLDYTAGGAPVQDVPGNDVANLSGRAVTNNTASLAPNVPTFVSPAAGAQVNTTTPSLNATFSDADTNNTGQITFRVCADSGCSTVLATFSSSTGIANGANGSASVPGGTFPSDGTYYWQAKATDNTSASSAFSSSRAIVIDTTAPSFTSATVNGSTLTVTLDESLNPGSTPAGSAFVVKQNGTTQSSPTGVSISGSTVTLTLATAVKNDDVVTVAYNQPGSGRIKDVAGNDASTFGAQAVTNNTASVAPNTPSLTSPADSVTIATFTPSLHASFSDPDTNNTGRLTFRVCTDSSCTNVVSLFNSASGILNGGNGSATVPGGDLTVDGTYYWQARAMDNQGVLSGFSASRSFTVDTTPPVVPTIDSGPGAASTSGPDVSFAFSDTEGSATFEVNLDGIGWNPGTSPKAYTNLTDGSHTFQVRAIDTLGNTSAPRTRTWTVDAVAPPTPTIDSGPAAASTSGKNVSFGFSDTEGTATFEVQLDGGGYSSASTPKSYSNLSDGSHTFNVRALDAREHERVRDTHVDGRRDRAAGADDRLRAGRRVHHGQERSFGFSDSEGGATLEIQIDGGGFAGASSPRAYPNLSDGSHTFQVRAVDAYGNVSTVTSRTWTVDATAPACRRSTRAPPQPRQPARTSPSASPTRKARRRSRSSSTAAATACCFAEELLQPERGSHTFDVRAVDVYGNTSAAVSRTWTVDAVAPALPTIDSGPAAASTSGKNVSFGFSDTEGTATFEVQLDGGGYSSLLRRRPTATSPTARTPRRPRPRRYGNTSSSTSRTWTVDAVAPALPTIDSGPTAASTSGKNVSFGFSDTEGTATFEVQIDGGGYSSAARRRPTATSPTARTPSTSAPSTPTATPALDQPHLDRRRDRPRGPEHRHRPRRRLDLRPQRQLRLLRHGRHGDVRSPDRRGRLHQRHLPEGLRRPERRFAHLRRPRPRRPRQHLVHHQPHLDRRRDRAGRPDDRQRPRRGLDHRPERQLWLLRHGRHRHLRVQARLGRVRRLHQREGVREPRRRLAHGLLPRGRHARQHERVRLAHVDGGRHSAGRPDDRLRPAAACTTGKNVSFSFSDTEGTRHLEIQLDGGGYRTRPARRPTRTSPTARTRSTSARSDAYGNTSSGGHAHVDGRCDRACRADDRLRPGGRLHVWQERQLRLLRHGGNGDVRSPD